MFIDIYFSGRLPLDRDEIEEAFAEVTEFEIVGAGSGEAGSNLDLEVGSAVDRADALRIVAEVLHQLGVAEISHVRISDTGERIAVVDLI